MSGQPNAQPVPSAQQVIARGAGSNAFSFVIRFAARAGFLWIAAHLFGISAYGVFAVATAVIELAVPLASLGLKRMIFPWLEARDPAQRPTHVLLDALLMATVATLAMSAAIVTFAWVLPDALVSADLRLALIALAPALFGQVFADIALAATRWTHAMRWEVTGRGAIEPYTGTLVTLGAWLLGWTRLGLVVGYWAGSAALVGYALWGARRCLGPFALRDWSPQPRALAARARLLTTASGADALTALAQRIDVYLVGFLLGDKAAGLYGVVRQLRTPILQVRQAFDGILTPVIARTMRGAGDIVTGEATAAAMRLILTIQLAVVLLMTAAGEPLLRLFGESYVAGYPALVLLCFAEAASGAFGVSEIILYYRKPSLALALNLLMIAVPAALVPLLAPRFGVTGAAAAVLVATFAAAGLRRAWLTKFGIRRHLLHASVPMAGAALAAATGFAAHQALLGRPEVPLTLAALGPAPLVLAVYAAAIWLWTRQRPGALSLARFRVD